MKMIHEPARDLPLIEDGDVCVIGGSTTGVFAAVAAARMGCRVALVEALGLFGGTATASLVNVWHPRYDTTGTREIIGGLAIETMERLKKRDTVIDRGNYVHGQYYFSPAELAIELDEWVREHPPIHPFLHTRFCRAFVKKPGHVEAVAIEDKSGRHAIRARVFVDASGDADLVFRAGLPTYRTPVRQPPTTCFIAAGLDAGMEKLRERVFDPAIPGALRPGFLWSAPIPGTDLRMVAGTRVHGADVSDADDLTRAEMEGRRQVRAILDIACAHVPGCESARLVALPARIGERESRHIRGLHRLTETELLHGVRFPDAIANGTYPVDIHSGDGEGVVFRYLDGREVRVGAGGQREEGRWALADGQRATFYQIPFRSLIPQGAVNVVAAGRCLDADEGAFGAARVMIHCAQMGQAAGIAAALAAREACAIQVIDMQRLRSELASQGAIIL